MMNKTPKSMILKIIIVIAIFIFLLNPIVSTPEIFPEWVNTQLLFYILLMIDFSLLLV